MNTAKPWYKSKKFLAMAVAVIGVVIAASLHEITWQGAVDATWKILASYLLAEGAADAAGAYSPPPSTQAAGGDIVNTPDAGGDGGGA